MQDSVFIAKKSKSSKLQWVEIAKVESADDKSALDRIAHILMLSSDNAYQVTTSIKLKKQLTSSVDLYQTETDIKVVSSKTGSFVRCCLSDIN